MSWTSVNSSSRRAAVMTMMMMMMMLGQLISLSTKQRYDVMKTHIITLVVVTAVIVSLLLNQTLGVVMLPYKLMMSHASRPHHRPVVTVITQLSYSWVKVGPRVFPTGS